jgi:hypothetical protein
MGCVSENFPPNAEWKEMALLFSLPSTISLGVAHAYSERSNSLCTEGAHLQHAEIRHAVIFG